MLNPAHPAKLIVPKGGLYPLCYHLLLKEPTELIPMSATECWGALLCLPLLWSISALGSGGRTQGWPGEELDLGSKADDGPPHGSTLWTDSCPETRAWQRTWEGGRDLFAWAWVSSWGWSKGGRDRKCSISGDADNRL